MENTDERLFRVNDSTAECPPNQTPYKIIDTLVLKSITQRYSMYYVHVKSRVVVLLKGFWGLLGPLPV